ncbi:hypothetical protein G6F65_018737 [Rhizopus arrhizus]|nr:hypothetical protein G6F65_018737 [Rhizopus arrhizus]
MAQMPPMQIPTSIRAPRSQGMDGASALARLAAVSIASRPQSSQRRSAPLAPTTTRGSNSAARIAGTKSISPPSPTDTCRSPVMGTSRPTGSISVVTTLNVAKPTARTPSQARREVWMSGSERESEDEGVLRDIG